MQVELTIDDICLIKRLLEDEIDSVNRRERDHGGYITRDLVEAQSALAAIQVAVDKHANDPERQKREWARMFPNQSIRE